MLDLCGYGVGWPRGRFFTVFRSVRVASSAHNTSILAGRWAGALLSLAEPVAVREAVERDFRALAGVMAESAEVQQIIKNPVLPREVQQKAVDTLADICGFADLTRRFLGTMVASRRLPVLEAVIEVFLNRSAAARGETTAHVTVAVPLDEDQTENLKKALTEALGQQVVLDMKVDAGLLGGLVVQADSRLFDASLRTRLSRLGRVLKEAS